MDAGAIFLPAAAMVLLTGAVLVRMFLERKRQVRAERIHFREIPSGSQMAARFVDTRAADNYRNLFEMPVLFYAALGAAAAPGRAAQPSRRRWRCRRGMRELDQLLERWLEREWRTSPTAQRDAFLRLLDSEDDRLWRWCLGHETPPDVEILALVERIRQP